MSSVCVYIYIHMNLKGRVEGGRDRSRSLTPAAMSSMLPVSDGKLESHVPDHMVAQAGTQGNPVLKGIHSHGHYQT